jgi:hypothetical protein
MKSVPYAVESRPTRPRIFRLENPSNSVAKAFMRGRTEQFGGFYAFDRLLLLLAHSTGFSNLRVKITC